MVQLKKHIIHFTLAIVLAVLAVANAAAQKPVQSFEVSQCDTLEFRVDQIIGDRYTWDLYANSNENFAIEQGDMESAIYFENGMYEGAIVRVLNLPAGTYFLRIMAWDEVNCTNNLLVFQMDVIEPPPPELVGDSLCIGQVPMVKVTFTGSGPWDYEYAFSDGVNTVNLIGHTDDPEVTIPITDPLPVGETKFWIMEVTDACTVKTYETDPPSTGILIYPKPSQSQIYLKDD